MSIDLQKAFPVGYLPFHKDEGLNFQLNRFYSQGVFDRDELFDIARQIDDFPTWIALFTKLGAEAEQRGELLKAATCFRAAQFYTISGELDADGTSLKHRLYERCRTLYDAYFAEFSGLTYEQVPFQDYQLPVYYATCANPKGTIVMHGGYDSIAQEFLILVPYLQSLGYDTYFFEGPGQGEVLMRYDVRMTHEWEHCTSAVLDHFGLDDVTLIGISLGGYLAPRAAAFDRRIARVVLYDLIYDFYGAILNKMGRHTAALFDYLTRHPKNPLWHLLNRRFDQNYFTKWLLGQGYAIYEGVHTPCEYFNHIRRFNTREISGMLTQDVLVLAGASDLYTIFYEDQLAALTNARSVTGRLFTKEECADHHCQIGNMWLLLQTIVTWIEDMTHA